MSNETPNNQHTRLLKVKIFYEQLVMRQSADGPPGTWEAPVSQGISLADQISAWVDETGHEVVAPVAAPSIWSDWVSTDNKLRILLASVAVTYIPVVVTPTPLIHEVYKPYVEDWVPVTADS